MVFDDDFESGFFNGMKKLFHATLLVIASIPLFGANEWLYYKHFPWVYDHQSKEWLYLNGSSDGKIYAYRQSTKEWAVFDVTFDSTNSSNQAEESNQAPTDLDHVGNLAVVKSKLAVQSSETFRHMTLTEIL